MSTSKHIDKVCCIVIVWVLVLTALFVNAEKFGITAAEVPMGYEERLFDTERMHTIDIVMDDWDGFLDTCENEEYELCSLVIDQEAYKNVGIRAKGNTSLSMVSNYGNDRYSFKVEFDHYDNTNSYYGLDKLSLNNIIQDNTYMKDYLVYQMMGFFSVSAPLCSYVYLTVNGEDWGLYLAVEGVEESFLERNYGSDYGVLYKPDSMDMGGGRGNGGGFDIDQFQEKNQQNTENEPLTEGFSGKNEAPAEGFPGGGEPLTEDIPGGGEPPTEGKPPSGENSPHMGADSHKQFDGSGNGKRGMGSDDVSLIYSDDDYDSYTNIFENAKTKISDADKDRLIASLKKMNEYSDIESVVDIDAVIRYFVVHNFVCNFDSYTGSMIHNYYLYEKNGQLSMIPWDYNLAFGGFQSQSDADGLINYPIDSPVSGGDVDSRPMLAWIFKNDQYTELYHQYFAEFISEYFDSGVFSQMIDKTTTLIAPYVEKDPTKFCTYEEFETGATTLKAFCELRAKSISGQLDGTIPSTSDGQAQNSSARIDSSAEGFSIKISDMGSMGASMNGGRGGFDGRKYDMQQERDS